MLSGLPLPVSGQTKDQPADKQRIQALSPIHEHSCLTSTLYSLDDSDAVTDISDSTQEGIYLTMTPPNGPSDGSDLTSNEEAETRVLKAEQNEVYVN